MRSQKQQIATLRLPRFDVRKNRSKRSIKNLDRAVINVVGLDPLEKHAAGLQTPVDRLVVLPGKKSRHARPIGIGRLRDDNVVFVAGGEEQFPRVADCHV